MTSSSDTEFHRRRIFVDGLPAKVTTTEVRSIFEPFGTVNFVHLSKNRGFVTFEDEESVVKALDLHGQSYKDCILIVQPESQAAMPFPVIAKREIHFPKIPSMITAKRSVKTQVQNKKSSKQRGLERKSSHPNIVKILQSGEGQDERNKDLEHDFQQGFPDLYAKLFHFAYFPEVAAKIFGLLDPVSLLRCRLVCKEWAFNIDRFVIHSPISRKQLMESWRSGNCSITPLTPDGSELQDTESAKARYRNILNFKADETEIMLAVDNGNIEIYDRYSLKLTCLLVGQYSASPVKLDFNDNLIFVQYTCAFFKSRKSVPSSWWNIYCRKSKRLLRSIDRDQAGSCVDIRLNSQDSLYLVSKSSIYVILLNSSRPQMNKIIHFENEEEAIEAFDIDAEDLILVHRNSLGFYISKFQGGGGQEKSEKSQLEQQCQLYKMEDLSVSDFGQDKCTCLSLQVKGKLCMTLLSNNRGSFEYLGGRPYVLIIFTDLVKGTNLRILTLDAQWMNTMSETLVPYDNESCLVSAKFNLNHLALGFGSFSDKNDGAIALWSMDEILDETKEKPELWTLPAPVYHWDSWDCHTGGVNCLHIDSLGLMASNACQHQLTTRCIERTDESKKDNLLIYDFWSKPVQDKRREQCSLMMVQ